MQVLSLLNSLRRAPTRYGELLLATANLWADKPVTLALASQKLTWRVIQTSITRCSVWVLAMASLSGQTMVFWKNTIFSKYTYNLHATGLNMFYNI
jgi:hypothetical protein